MPSASAVRTTSGGGGVPDESQGDAGTSAGTTYGPVARRDASASVSRTRAVMLKCTFPSAPGWANYRTPVNRLYLCGSATHPGGGIMAAPGRNAAMRVLEDVR